MSKRLLVAEQWDMFARAIVPVGCSPVQKQEMRRAFYAGAQGVLFGVIFSLGTDEEAREADMQVIRDVHDELNSFSEMVKQGRA